LPEGDFFCGNDVIFPAEDDIISGEDVIFLPKGVIVCRKDLSFYRKVTPFAEMMSPFGQVVALGYPAAIAAIMKGASKGRGRQQKSAAAVTGVKRRNGKNRGRPYTVAMGDG